jgi:hypothetical protein
MATRDYGSYIFHRGVTPNTLSVISSKNRVLAINSEGATLNQIGVIASFDPSETRTVEPVRGIGFGDYIAELVPGVTDPMTLAVTRTALYISMIFQVFGYKGGIDGFVRSLRHHRWPFDIQQELVFSTIAMEHAGTSNMGTYTASTGTIDDVSARGANAVNKGTAIVTQYQACWISDYSVSFASDTALVQESVTINVTDIVGIGEGGVQAESGTIDSINKYAISARTQPPK